MPGQVGESHNMDIRFVPFAARGAEIAALSERGWLGPRVGQLAAEWRDSEFERCLAITTRGRSSNVTETAHIYIKAELRPIWRETCIIEEMTQSLGLLNDDPRVQPSIFNDDGTYLTLTTHDEFLLRILYDRRIRPGMRSIEAAPIAAEIIQGFGLGSAGGLS